MRAGTAWRLPRFCCSKLGLPHGRVGTVFGHNQTVLFAKPASYMGGAVGQFSSQGGRRYVIENVREALDASDEFYHDPEMAELLYIPENVPEFSG
eukprot:COSAG06_NODE_39001_length_417_cov_1.066038_1_plen_94_part_01